MPLFRFKAKKEGGEIYEGKREAVDKFVLYHEIKAEGGNVLFVEEVKKAEGLNFSFLSGIFGRVKTKDRIIFARNLGSMLEAGLSVSRALSIIERQSTKKGLKDVIRRLIEEINKGQALSDSMEKFPRVFSQLFVSMVRAGEESGSLPASLKSVGEQMNKMYTLEKRVKGAMIYPAVILVIMTAIGVIMLVYVVPTLTSTFQELNVELPASTKLVIAISDLFLYRWMFLIPGAAALIWLFLWFRKTNFGKRLIAQVLLRMPIIKNLIKETNSARTARTLSSLLSAGVEVVESMEITAQVIQNVLFKDVINSAKEKIKTGETVATVFSENENLYPVLVGEMISIGEETGKLGEMLSNLAGYYEEEVDQKTKDFSTIIEPFLMIFIAAVVGFFAIAMLSPTYSLVNAF